MIMYIMNNKNIVIKMPKKLRLLVNKTSWVNKKLTINNFKMYLVIIKATHKKKCYENMQKRLSTETTFQKKNVI